MAVDAISHFSGSCHFWGLHVFHDTRIPSSSIFHLPSSMILSYTVDPGPLDPPLSRDQSRDRWDDSGPRCTKNTQPGFPRYVRARGKRNNPDDMEKSSMPLIHPPRKVGSVPIDLNITSLQAASPLVVSSHHQGKRRDRQKKGVAGNPSFLAMEAVAASL